MQPLGVYNLQVESEDPRFRPNRIGLLNQRTGVPVFLLYLTGIDRIEHFELHSIEDVENVKFKSSGDWDRQAWQAVLAFFEAEGQSAHVVATPLSDTKNLLKQMLGQEKGISHRSGLFALKNYVELADLVVVPQASQYLDPKSHRVFYQKLFELSTTLEHFFVIVDFPKTFGPKQIKTWKKGLHTPDAAMYYPWLLDNTTLIPPGSVVAASYQTNDQRHGIQDTPANRELKGPYKPLLGFSPNELKDFNELHLNCLHSFRDGTVRIWGGYTLSDSLDFDAKYIATRRTLIAVREAIHKICEPFVLEPMVHDLSHTIDVSLHSFFQDNKKIFDSNAKKAFETDVSIENEGGEDIVKVNIKMGATLCSESSLSFNGINRIKL